MALVDIIRMLGAGLVALAAVMLAPLAVAIGEGPETASAYLFAAIATMGAGLAMIVIGRGEGRPTDVREAILLAFLWWTIAPVFGAAPLALDGLSPFEAYFEAVSALTTTGAWLSEAGARASPAAMLWRACLQWIGGLVSLSVAAAIFIQPIFVGIEAAPPHFARRESDSYVRAIESALRYFLPAYLAITALCCAALTFSGQSLLNALVTSLSATASGGFIAERSADGGVDAVAAGALAPFVFASGASFTLIAQFGDRRRRRLQDKETGAYALVVLVVAVLLWLFAGAAFSDSGAQLTGARGVEGAAAQFFNAASLMSTNGVVIGETPNLPVALVAVVIGGAAVSTAGGLKILRWLVIFRRVREEVRRLVTPRAVFGRSFVENELGVWMHFLVFTFTIGCLTMALTAGGHSFELSAAMAAGVLSNAGPVAHLAEGGEAGYGVVSNPMLRLALVSGMILGRIEAVAALALFNRAFWRS